MHIPTNILYLTNEKGIRTAVQIPFDEWDILLKEYIKLTEINSIKSELKKGLTDLINIEKGKSKEISLSEFLNDY